MIFLLNLIFAIIAFLVSRYLLGVGKVNDPVNVVLSVLVAVVVFISNLAARVV